MLTSHSGNRLYFYLCVAALSITIGAAIGFRLGVQPVVLGLGLVPIAIAAYVFMGFERVVLGLLILRSALDVFSAQQLPAAFALGLDLFTLAYVAVQFLTRQPIQTDKFFWFFSGWVALQGIWVVLLPLGGLGLGAEVLPESIREWIRLFSWVMVYLLVMQLKGKVPPQQVVYALFFALILPIVIAVLQMAVPSVLPPMFAPSQGDFSGGPPSEGTSRIRGTLGHPNTFVTFLLMFMGLTYWRLKQSKFYWPWFLLMALLAFFYVSTKSLFGLMMLATFIFVLIAPSLSVINLLGGVVLFAGVIFLFGSTEFGQERLGSIAQTPLGNPDIDIWRAILLSAGDGNSFNWRIAQWTYLLEQWQQFPLLGFGLGISAKVSTNGLYPHNDYVRALIEGGIVGFVTFIGFLGVQIAYLIQLFRRAISNAGQRDLCLILLAILLALPVGMITENIWSHTTLFFYWWTLFGIVSWDWSNQAATESSQLLPSQSHSAT